MWYRNIHLPQILEINARNTDKAQKKSRFSGFVRVSETLTIGLTSFFLRFLFFPCTNVSVTMRMIKIIKKIARESYRMSVWYSDEAVKPDIFAFSAVHEQKTKRKHECSAGFSSVFSWYFSVSFKDFMMKNTRIQWKFYSFRTQNDPAVK